MMRFPTNGSGLLELIKEQALVRQLRKRRGLNYYLSERGAGLHYGVFGSFEEARQWLPPSKEFDHPEFTDEYVNIRTRRVFCFDYPVMLWLKHAFSDGATSIFDIGGSVGVHYYAYQPYMAYPAALSWHVCELPASVTRGRELAHEHGVSQLSFTEQLDPADIQADIWMAAGAIEFIEDTSIEKLLSAAARKPGHILLNKMPLHDGNTYVSTQNIGKGSFVPHHVYNRDQYVAGIERFGYELVDSWEVLERAFSVPGVPELCFRHYSGLYFRAV